MTESSLRRIFVTQAPEQAGIPLRLNIPFEPGLVKELAALQLLCADKPIEFFASILATWPDGSIKWLMLGFLSQQDCLAPIFLHHSADTTAQNNSKHNDLLITAADDKLHIRHVSISDQSTEYVFSISQPNLSTFFATSAVVSDPRTGLTLRDAQNREFQACGEHHHIERFYCPHSQRCLAADIVIEGKFTGQAEIELRFTQTLSLQHGSPFIQSRLQIHNPKAARHQNGQWDLGDEQSFLLQGIHLSVSVAATCQLSLSSQSQRESQLFLSAQNGDLLLEQYASGGDNWQSPVHVSADNQVHLPFNGFRLTQGKQPIQQGKRSEPLVTISQDKTHCAAIAFPGFWQRFPSRLLVLPHKLELSLLAAGNEHYEELQGGEKFSHHLWMSLANDHHSLDWVYARPLAYLASEDYLCSQAIPFLAALENSSAAFAPLIQNCLDEQSGFFAKRELIDEFGWRHFGDLYADHETSNYQGNELFVSHYNNQYDPIFGFLKQFLLSGDARWFTLADDLARHVKDIDIYHTHDDKAEYNGGLFWHTDHYLKAYTSSHRSYSKLQESNVYQDHAGGGGPGGQHCYTSGLALHHFVTGDVSSKNAVLTLTRWITHVYEGTGTCLELLLAFKNRHQAGLKNHFSGQYPLDRGTANYLHALLDSYELTRDSHYKQRAEHILYNTLHPHEDVALRNLQDVENTWFYTVLLQALCRYLLLLQSENQLNQSFYYCRDSLLNYARWMADNEYIYLQKPEILEYPNDTWTAQDLRKAHIFAAAAYYSHDNNALFLAKAQYFEQEVAARLNSSATKTYTRIQVLVLQNVGAVDFYRKLAKTADVNASQPALWPPANYQTTGLLRGLVSELGKRLVRLSIKQELNWLKKRIK